MTISTTSSAGAVVLRVSGTQLSKIGAEGTPGFDKFGVTLTEKIGQPIRMPEQLAQRTLDVLAHMAAPPEREPDNSPNQLYAQIVTGNKTIAKLYNSGIAELAGNAGVQFGGSDEDGLSGPALAEFRAEKIAHALGGTIVRSGTAMTQAEWQSRPAALTHS